MNPILPNGQIFGSYRVIRLLGSGTLGEVYEVEHTDLKQRFALKLIRPELVSDSRQVERFKDEARIMSGMNHSNVLRVDDFGETDGYYWLRMPLLRGGSLLDRLSQARDGRLDQADALRYLKQLLDGLVCVHGSGVIHRDLKPGNLLFDERGVLRISDFGIFESQDASDEGDDTSLSNDPDATTLEGSEEHSSSPEGTFTYMSPEQKRGEAVDARSDLYSAALIAYQMLTGESVLGMQTPTELVPQLDPAWDAWVKRATALKPEARFKDAQSMLDALPALDSSMRAKPSKSVKASDSSPQKSKKGLWIGGGVAVVVLIVVALLFSMDSESSVDSAGAPPVVPSDKKGSGEPKAEPDKEEPPVVAVDKGETFQIDELGLTMLWLEKGSFEMGSTIGEADELPVHKVKVDGFWIGETEITRAQWFELMQDDSSSFQQLAQDAPIDSTSWQAAIDYCERLTESFREAGRLPKGYVFTLPTEAEWEYAARAGADGNSLDGLTDRAWFKASRVRKPQSVAQKEPNSWGLYDTAGNVWEWTRSQKTKYRKHAIAASEADQPVLRGGAWNSDQMQIRPTERAIQIEGMVDLKPGFRIVLTRED